MNKNILIIAILILLLISSCKQANKQKGTDTAKEKVENISDAIIKTTITNKDDEKLYLLFNNENGTVTLNYNNETINLISQKPASGIWYNNEQYELRGKGNNITLKKDGNIIFEHQDDVVSIEAKNDKGEVLNLTFNNTEGTVKAYLNGGKQIDLTQEKAASGIWYKNEHYELSGKGNSYALSKDGKLLFKN